MKRLEQLVNMMHENPDDPFICYAMAKELEYEEMEDEALEMYHKLMVSHPEYVGLYYHYGKLLEKKLRKNEAMDVYSKGIDMAKSLSDFHALSELNSARTNMEIE
jgi:tetratricopeptide (TPR) repeat protein